MADLDGIIAVFQALLRIAEIEAGARRSAFAAIDLGPLLADLAELYGAVAEERGIRLELQAPAHLPILRRSRADPAGGGEPARQRRQVLAARRPRVGRGGAGRHAASRSPCPTRARASRPTIARGPERFYRGEAARSTPGAGLGLALVQAVAQLHGGDLALDDAAPGLRAVLRLPLSGSEGPT